MTQTIFTSEVRGLRTSEYRKVIYDTDVLMAFYGKQALSTIQGPE